jgi:stage V sporulation protein G
MEITEVRIKLMEESEDRLRAFCSITIDNCFVVRDLKIIEGASGPFVAMPSRKLTERCNKCGYKNHLRSNFCNQCGVRLKSGPHSRSDSESGSNKLYADIAHPINQGCRDIIQSSVITEYYAELDRARLPGYKSRYDDEYSETIRQSHDETLESPQDALTQTTNNREQWNREDQANSPAQAPHLDSLQEERERDKAARPSEGFGQGILDNDEPAQPE